MNKPEWAEEWNESEFDYGFQKGYAAKVGPFRQAVRYMQRIEVEPPEYEWGTTTTELWCDECGEYHEVEHEGRRIIKPGVYKNVDLPGEDEVHTTLLDWFKQRARDCRKYLKTVEKWGW